MCNRILALACIAGILATLSASAQQIYRTELLGRPGDHSITLSIAFQGPTEASVEVGTVPGSYTSGTPWQLFPDSMPHEILVNGLQTDTRYYYRLSYRLPGTTNVLYQPERTFHTHRPPGATFTFVIQADPHMDNQTDTAVYSRCLQNQLDDAPDFMVDLGDFLMTDKLKNAAQVVPFDTIPYRCNLLRSYYEKTCHSVPLFITMGNHEGEAGWYLNGTANNMAVWDAQQRKQYFPNPFPDGFYVGDTSNVQFIGQRQSYYAWEWGNALFVVLDPYWYTTVKPDSLHGWRWTLGQVQYDWLRNTLQNSTATFKYVFSHHLVGGSPEGRGGTEYADFYEWGGNNIDSTDGFAVNRPGWYKPIKDVLTENRVNVFFHGHDHFFDKQQKDCMIYQEVPQPSHPNFSNANSAVAYGYLSGQLVPNSGHLRVTVSPTGTMVEYVRAYKASDETPTRHNKDISATYFIGNVNCYDSVSTSIPVLWNSDYADEIVYPNPFSDETRIRFSLKEQDEVNITVCDVQGRIVRKLLSGNPVRSGAYTVVWDGNDNAGEAVPGGTYIYRIESPRNGAMSGKLIVTR
jgi:hypothetical protein